ncbi:predicted protein [Naegleria gruberi]|uniref:Predicted protein n=1 Tax=Naegleria gruberi TaxID=5762 RepID=D2W2D5_NAEGR|nr:uncharacterized protein NAEGRDRAFT_82131 [Naegleria gruberi]EFC36809.1 predicted protein [Naegleria gruberi]|eukprot:XP_002669553.1 predicted protein [Naegleria gruberi strain NEG-M]
MSNNQTPSSSSASTTTSDNTNFQDKSHWENKVKFMEHSKIFLNFFASDLIQRSLDLYLKKSTTQENLVSILDVATGTGLVPFKFIDENIVSFDRISSLNGIDFAPNMIEGAEYKKQARMEEKKDEFDWDKLKFQVMDGQDLKFSDESFDIVYSNMGVLFYPKMVQGLSEIRRVLKKGGMAFLNAWTGDFPTRVGFHAVFDVLQKDDRYALPVFSLQDPKIFEERCKEAGFENVEIKQVTQSLKLKYSELQYIINTGAQFVAVVQKYLLENPHITTTEKELLDRIDQLSRKAFNIVNEDEEIQVVSTANQAIAQLSLLKMDADDTYTTKAISDVACLQGVDLSNDETLLALMPTLIKEIGGEYSEINWVKNDPIRFKDELQKIYGTTDLTKIVKEFSFSDGIRTWGGGYSRGSYVFIFGKELKKMLIDYKQDNEGFKLSSSEDINSILTTSPSSTTTTNTNNNNNTINNNRIDFAKQFSMNDFFDKEKRLEFLELAFHREGLFATSHRIGLNEKCGLTYDGHQINLDNSSIHEPLHDFSSPAKESIHLNMITLALDGNELARKFFLLPLLSKSNNLLNIDKLNENGKRLYQENENILLIEYLIDILEKKFKSYEDFDRKFPAFGSMLPWFRVNDDGADRMPDWLLRIPSLDNGQFIWSLIALEHILLKVFNNNNNTTTNNNNTTNNNTTNNGNSNNNNCKYFKSRAISIVKKIQQKIEMIKSTSLILFYHGDGKVRAISYIKDINVNPLLNYSRNNYKGNGKSFIDDTYEGEMMVMFMLLFGNWKILGIEVSSKCECEKIWKFKSRRIKKVNYKSKNYGEIAVEECYWASSHEKWKYLILPYIDSDINRKIFENGEKVRLINSIENSIPGLFASVTKPHTKYNPKYASECGIPSISREKVIYENIVTPYASFPTILANYEIGMIWYWNMLNASRMQGIYGSTESIHINGKKICPVLTWDSKITTIVALCGGIFNYTREYMKKHNVYNEFIQSIDREWSRVFSLNDEASHISFTNLLPSKSIPKIKLEFDWKSI